LLRNRFVAENAIVTPASDLSVLIFITAASAVCIKGRIADIEVFRIQPFLYDPEGFAETGRLK